MTNFSRNLTMKFTNVRYGISLEKKIVTCIIEVHFNHYAMDLIGVMSPKEYRRLKSVCDGPPHRPVFTVTGRAKCFTGDAELPEDEFDERIGQKIAYRRAKRKALRRCRAILKYYNKVLAKVSVELINNVAIIDGMIEHTDEELEALGIPMREQIPEA